MKLNISLFLTKFTDHLALRKLNRSPLPTNHEDDHLRLKKKDPEII